MSFLRLERRGVKVLKYRVGKERKMVKKMSIGLIL